MTFALRVHLYPSVHKGDVLKLGNQVEVSEEGRLDLRAQRLQIRIRGFGAVRLDARAACAPESADIRRAKSASRGAKRRSGPRWCGPLSGSQPPVRENGRASASQPSPLSRKHAPPCPSGRTSRTQ